MLHNDSFDINAGCRALIVLADIIEQARLASLDGGRPDTALRDRFVRTLALVIRDAMGVAHEDLAFQRMVWRYRWPRVREYDTLRRSANQDERALRAVVNAMAHPVRQQSTEPGWRRDMMARVHDRVMSGRWHDLAEAIQDGIAMRGTDMDSEFRHQLVNLRDRPELARLRRTEALKSDPEVREYRALRERLGPRSGSVVAAERGAASRQRGAVAEHRAAQAVRALAARLNGSNSRQSSDLDDARATGTGDYRVVTEMHVPARLSAGVRHAKTEWDVVLLRYVGGSSRHASDDGNGKAGTLWDVCRLVEAKASAVAVTTDLPRMQRGLTLLANADADATYTFETRQGPVAIRGVSLCALSTDDATLMRIVRYCCGAQADPESGAGPVDSAVLDPANRMRLLSSLGCLEYASGWAQTRDPDVGLEGLESVWHELLVSPRLRGVLNHQPTARLARQLMIHPDCLARFTEWCKPHQRCTGHR